MEKIEDLWKSIISYGKMVRAKNLDGLQSWIKIKDLLKNNKEEGRWNDEIVTIYGEMKSKLGLKEEECEIKDGPNSHEEWEKHHVYLQHARIPTLNYGECQLYRIMQIAYNAGQYNAFKTDSFYNVSIKGINNKTLNKYYDEKKLSDISTYINKNDLIKFEKSLDKNLLNSIKEKMDDQTGGNYELESIKERMGEQTDGNYELKYKKYKSKYLNLKKYKKMG